MKRERLARVQLGQCEALQLTLGGVSSNASHTEKEPLSRKVLE